MIRLSDLLKIPQNIDIDLAEHVKEFPISLQFILKF